MTGVTVQETNCAYVILIMAVYWMTEALPMAVTALLPVVLMPWLDVMSSKQLCSNYLKVRDRRFKPRLMREMQTIVINDSGICQSACHAPLCCVAVQMRLNGLRSCLG